MRSVRSLVEPKSKSTPNMLYDPEQIQKPPSTPPAPAATPTANNRSLDDLGLASALAKARKSYQEGGIPIGAALVYHGTSHAVANAAVLGCAHNSRIQKSSPTLHAEIAALEDAGRLKGAVYRHSTMVCPPRVFGP